MYNGLSITSHSGISCCSVLIRFFFFLNLCTAAAHIYSLSLQIIFLRFRHWTFLFSNNLTLRTYFAIARPRTSPLPRNLPIAGGAALWSRGRYERTLRARYETMDVMYTHGLLSSVRPHSIWRWAGGGGGSRPREQITNGVRHETENK